MRKITWQPKDLSGFESLYLEELKDGFCADSIVLARENGERFRLHYRIYMDKNWQPESLQIGDVFGHSEYQLNRGVNNTWDRSDVLFDDDERDFAGCTDLDLSCTPFTNTLPIRRLNLEIGQSADIQALYINCPEIRFEITKQRYARLSEFQYRFTSLDVDFTAIITVDAEGFVTDYPGLFERRYP
jgi:uncharacterized protein